MHNIVKDTLRCVLLSLLILLLAGCGGGGSSSDNQKDEASKIQTGNLSGLQVKGLYYETESLAGTTGNEGQYRYRVGETISFSLGETQLGSAEAKAELSPFDWLGIEPPQDETEIVGLLKRPMINSFDMVMNASVLLISLDIDGQIENGINLGPAHRKMTGKDELELAKKSKDFHLSPDIKSTVNDLVGRDPVTFQVAANYLYQNLGLSLEVKRVIASAASGSDNDSISTSVSFNQNGDIDSERIVLAEDAPPIEIHYSYDADARLKSIQNSYTQQTELYVYEQDLLSQRELRIDGSQDIYRERFSYNQKGELTQLAIDKDGDGSDETITEFSYSPVREQVKVKEQVDGNLQEFISTRQLHQGRVERVLDDYNGDGQAEVEIIYHYDALSRISSREIISSDPDIESGLSYFEYDDQDRLIGYKQDQNQDGIYEYIEVYGYDEADNRILFKKDKNADGMWDYISMTSFDAQGNRIEVQEDSDGNGVIDHHWRAELEDVSLESGWDAILAGL